MSVEVEISGRVPSRLGLTKAQIKKAMGYFAERSAARSGLVFHHVAVIVQNDKGSDEVHQGIMGVVGATDVITQRYEAMPPEPPGVYGEVYVNAERAMSAAPKRKSWSPAHEFLLYLAHGADHLSEADDHTEKGYQQMRRRELGWLKAFFRLTGLASFAFLCVFGCPKARAQAVDFEEDSADAYYVQLAAAIDLPQGGSHLKHRCGGALVRAGRYVTEFLAVEAEVGLAENLPRLGVMGRWHWWGFERFDPFFTFGARGWINGAVGPCGGLGFYYHLTDTWSFVADASCVLDVAHSPTVVSSMTIGLNYSF